MVLGPRFLIQAGFIIAVAVVAGIERVGTWSIIGLVAGAWIVVAIVELGLWVRSAKAQRRAAPAAPPSEAPPPPALVHRPQPEPIPVPTPEPPLIAAAPPPPEPAAERPVRSQRGPVEGARGNREVPPTEAEAPEPTVAYLPVNEAPREWNLWELERASREHVSEDIARNEERAYLLMYLREFAGPDGTLPADFDGLVRDAFGDLLRVVTT